MTTIGPGATAGELINQLMGNQTSQASVLEHGWEAYLVDLQKNKPAEYELLRKNVQAASSLSRPEGVPSDAIDINGDGGVCKRVLVEGDATKGKPFEGAEVKVHFVGTLLSNGVEFDSSRKKKKKGAYVPFKFEIGRDDVIAGWDKGVAAMHGGEKAELYIRADYSYGEDGFKEVPPFATLKFEIELLGWGGVSWMAKN